MKNKDIIALLQSAYAAELETVANYLANTHALSRDDAVGR